MATSKKDYEAVAKALRDNIPSKPDAQTIRYMRNVARELAVHFERTNPRFDRMRFMREAGFYIPDDAAD